MITVKDFAAQQGCGESIIYRHIRNHKEQLGDNIQKINRKTWITDEGQQYLKQLLTKNNTLVISAEQNTRLQELEQENKQLQEEKEQMHKQIEALFLELTNVQKTLIDEKDKVQNLLEEKQLLIAEKAELSAQAQQQAETAKPWWRFW